MNSIIHKPVIILGSPRSGTTLLYTLLNKSSELFSLSDESRFIFRELYLKKLEQGIKFADDSLQDKDLDETDYKLLLDSFDRHSFRQAEFAYLVNKVLRKNQLGKLILPAITSLNSKLKNKPYRLLEKTPRNAFKIPIIERLFPDALYIFITRDGRSNVSSLIEGWRNREQDEIENNKRLPQLDTALKLSNFEGELWRFALPPGWQSYANKTLEEVCAYQWFKANQTIIEELAKVPSSRQKKIRYEDLIENPETVIKEVCEFVELKLSKSIQQAAKKPPEVNYLDEKPKIDKWRKNEKCIEFIMDMIIGMQKELGYPTELQAQKL